MKKIILTNLILASTILISPISYASVENYIYVISPHPDDALLTFGGYLSSLKNSGELRNKHVQVSVMASTTNYSTNWYNSLTNKRVLDISTERHSEDYRALSELLGGWNKFTYRSYGFFDAPLRGYSGPSNAGGGSSGSFNNFSQNEISMFNEMVEDLTPIMKRDNCTLLVPIANGSHIDHFITREAVLMTAATLGDSAHCKIKLGQDQPYTDANIHDQDHELNILKSRLPSYAITSEVIDIPKSNNASETIKMSLYKKYYNTQYDENYIPPLKSNTKEVIYSIDPSTYYQFKSHPDCTEAYCSTPSRNDGIH